MTITTEEAERLAMILNRIDMDRNAAALRSLAAERDYLEKTAMQAAQCHGRETLRADALQAENARLREALDFYGDVSKYPAPFTGGMGALWQDCGQIARAARGEKE
jgi:hypothetical protein